MLLANLTRHETGTTEFLAKCIPSLPKLIDIFCQSKHFNAQV